MRGIMEADKKKIAKLKKQYSVKGVKYFRGHDGYGFNASLYLGKKKIAFLIDLADGGKFQIEPFDEDEVKKLRMACEDEELVQRCGSQLKEWDYTNITFEWLVEELINDYENMKRLKREEKKQNAKN